MDVTPTPGLTETLANLSVLWVLGIVTMLTVMRLGIIKIPSLGARSFAEILESGIIAIVLVFLVIRPFIVQAYFIPSSSMEPTLLGNNNVGDRILVNKFIYRLHKPRHDDVVVFIAPPVAMAGNPDFIKRLIGLPGDRIQVIGGKITINGRDYHHGDIRMALAMSGAVGPAEQEAVTGNNAMNPNDVNNLQSDFHVKFVQNGVRVLFNDGRTQFFTPTQISTLLTGIPNFPVTIRPGQVIRNGVALNEPFIAEDPDYDMIMINGIPLKKDFDVPGSVEYRGDVNGQEGEISSDVYYAENKMPTQSIPPGRYLMMGDNRNDSDDSTFWGLLNAKRVVGKAQFIFWPLNRIGLIRN